MSAGIVHLGVGGFHRAHLAVHVDTLLEAGGASGWWVCGVGVLPHDCRLHEVLRRQDGLYTLVVKRPDGSRDGAGGRFPAPATCSRQTIPGAVVEPLADPAT